MEQLNQALQSYLNLRDALLHRLRQSPQSDGDLFDALDMTTAIRRRRLFDPGSWRFDELAQLAEVAGLSGRIIGVLQVQLALLKTYLTQLPEQDRQRFYASCQLNNRKLTLRQQDPQLWRTVELERIAAFLRRTR